MSYKAVVEGKGGIVVRVVADSVASVDGKRITTFEGEVHRSIWSEFMTHRVFSRNAMSSRAVPVSKMIENTKAVPIKFGAKKPGMAAGREHNTPVTLIDDFGTPVTFERDEAWGLWAEESRRFARAFDEAGYHKGDINRPLEAFQMMKFVMTSTELDNFFWLRRDETAKEEIKELADCMYRAVQESVPDKLYLGEWHLPYVNSYRSDEEDNYRLAGYLVMYVGEDKQVTLEEAKAISASCCAQVSYRNIDSSYDKAMDIYNKLGVGGNKLHASPFEHQAYPMESSPDCGNPCWWEDGVTHMDKNQNLWSGNFKGWIQHRQLLDNHTCDDYEATKEE